MGPVDAVVAMLAVAAPTAYVLRDVASYDRPARVAVDEPPVVTPVDVVVAPPVAAEPVVVTHGSMLAGLTTIEHDEHGALRRVGALMVLVTLTLLTAAGVYAVVYRTVSGLG